LIFQVSRDNAGPDIFWLRDESREESDYLPNPDVLAQEAGEDLDAALEQFQEIAADLGVDAATEMDR
jgi:type I restriction enzyme M protein